MKHVKSDVVVFRQPHSGWKITEARKILIPVAGLDSNDPLRARIAASLWRASQPDIAFVQILPSNTQEETLRKNHQRLSRFASRIIPGKTEVRIISNDNVVDELTSLSLEHDLVIMGLGKSQPSRKSIW